MVGMVGLVGVAGVVGEVWVVSRLQESARIFEVKPIQAVPTPITPYVAPIKKKLLLYAVRAVEKREHTQKQKHRWRWCSLF